MRVMESSDAPEPAYEARTQLRKGRPNAGTFYLVFQQNGPDGDRWCPTRRKSWKLPALAVERTSQHMC